MFINLCRQQKRPGRFCAVGRQSEEQIIGVWAAVFVHPDCQQRQKLDQPANFSELFDLCWFYSVEICPTQVNNVHVLWKLPFAQ
ncbi:hypothetical protein D3C85_1373230 [compost metagenome]